MNQRLLTDAASIVSLPKLFSFAETFDHHDDHHPVLLKWDDFMGPLIYLNKPRSYTVSIAIKLFADAGSSTTYASMFAMSTLSLLPVF